jgi:hypothetical protein
MVVFMALHLLEIRIPCRTVKPGKEPILSWALSLLRYVTPNNGNDFTPPPLMWFIIAIGVSEPTEKWQLLSLQSIS